MKQSPPWYVLTGGPCAGKTTLIQALAEQGYLTVPEAARGYIEEELRSGKTLAEIRGDEAEFQRRLIRIKREQEAALPRDQIVFFDRGMHDSQAYLEFKGVHDDPELLEALAHATYRKVFLLERLPLIVDNVRTETQEEAELLERLLEQSYASAGIDVVRVPVLPVPERLAVILSSIEP